MVFHCTGGTQIKVFEKRVWRGMSGEKAKGKGKNCIIRRLKYSSLNIAKEITLRIMGLLVRKPLRNWLRDLDKN